MNGMNMFGGMGGLGGLGGFDPSKMSPEVVAEISDLMRTLSPEQIMKMQTLMHNAMAGINVANDAAEFERSLPPGFREKLARIMYKANGVNVDAHAAAPASVESPTNLDEARLVLLRAVARGEMSPEDALKVLFPS